jgi:hypothetical protein
MSLTSFAVMSVVDTTKFPMSVVATLLSLGRAGKRCGRCGGAVLPFPSSGFPFPLSGLWLFPAASSGLFIILVIGGGAVRVEGLPGSELVL